MVERQRYLHCASPGRRQTPFKQVAGERQKRLPPESHGLPSAAGATQVLGRLGSVRDPRQRAPFSQFRVASHCSPMATNVGALQTPAIHCSPATPSHSSDETQRTPFPARFEQTPIVPASVVEVLQTN